MSFLLHPPKQTNIPPHSTSHSCLTLHPFYTYKKYQNQLEAMGTRRKRKARSPSPQGVQKKPRKGTKAWLKLAAQKLTQTDMVCVPGDQRDFEEIMEWHRREAEKRQSQEFELQVRIKANPRPQWTPSDDVPNPAKEDMAWRAPQLASVHTTNSDGEWVPPPKGVKLSDEGVYIAIKTLNCVERGQRYPVDFDQNGNVRATRTPEDPAKASGIAVLVGYF